MEIDKDKKNTKLIAGTWDKLETEDYQHLPKVKFEVNNPIQVEFKDEQPKEKVGEDGSIYYHFNVIVNGKDSIIQSSAWTFLRGVKKLGNLKGKKVSIIKKLIKGKNIFEITLV